MGPGGCEYGELKGPVRPTPVETRNKETEDSLFDPIVIMITPSNYVFSSIRVTLHQVEIYLKDSAVITLDFAQHLVSKRKDVKILITQNALRAFLTDGTLTHVVNETTFNLLIEQQNRLTTHNANAYVQSLKPQIKRNS